MPLEIERKFLPKTDAWRSAPGVYYCQGYLSRDQQRTVRVRVAGAQGYLTIKGANVGGARAEFEYAIPLDEAQQLLKLCDGPLVEKYRHVVHEHGFDWEVDAFLGENQGLVVAEIELDAIDQAFVKPDWVGEEVTADARYYNSNLSLHPFCRW